MFTTINQVKEFTGYDVSQETIVMAQSIIESYTGRVEADVDAPTDKELLGKAVAYQSAYMAGDESRVFEQIGAAQIQQFGQMVTFNNDGVSPWVAPLAVLACKKLSWKRMRSVRTGSLFPTGPVRDRWTTT